MRRNSYLTALAVDDDPEFLTSLKLMLRISGFRMVVTAANGAEAVELLREWRYDLIVSDWNMAPMDGLELLQHVRSEPKLSNIPFILVTASLSAEAWTGALDHGATDFLLKPFTLETFRFNCRIALDMHRGGAANVVPLPAPPSRHSFARP